MSLCQSHGRESEHYDDHQSRRKKKLSSSPLLMLLASAFILFLLYMFLTKKDAKPISKKPTKAESIGKNKELNMNTSQPQTSTSVQYETVNAPVEEGPSKDIHKIAKAILEKSTAPLSLKQKALLTQPKSLAHWKLVSEDPLVFFYRGKDENDVWQIYFQPDSQNYKLVHIDPSSSLSSEYSCYPGSSSYPECLKTTSSYSSVTPTWALVYHDSMKNFI